MSLYKVLNKIHLTIVKMTIILKSKVKRYGLIAVYFDNSTFAFEIPVKRKVF